MKILLINEYFSYQGGSENSTYNIGNILRKNDHEVFFFAFNKKPYIEQDYQYACFFPEYIIPNDHSGAKKLLLKLLQRINLVYNFQTEKKLDQLIKVINPDIVHINCLLALSPSVFKACYKNNIPMVMTLRIAELFCPVISMMQKNKTHCKDELCVAGNPLHCIINRCNPKGYLRSAFSVAKYLAIKILNLHNKVSIFICPSQAMLKLASRSGIKKEKYIHIPNFINDSWFEIQPEYSNKRYFLYVGRLSFEKGLHYLIEAMKRLPGIKLRIVGTGHEEKNLKKQAELLENVEFLEFRTGKNLEEEYKGCIATILPCIWFETFGLTIVESFTCGKPVIASKVGGIPEIIEDGINGILVEPGNVDNLVNAIKKLHSNNNLVIEMGKNGRAKAENNYTPQIHYEKLIKVYNTLLKGD